MQRRHLVIFTRHPRLRAGKRRLAGDIGPVEALRFQRVSLTNASRRLAPDNRWTTWLAVTPDRSGPWPCMYRIIPQGRGDLGQRLTRQIDRLPIGPVLIVGSDVPNITRALVSRTFHLLQGHDAVIGPAMDGGYWAVGLRRRPRKVAPFHPVRWSTSHAVDDTLRNLGGCSVAGLPHLEDIDEASSLARSPHWSVLHGPHYT
ncbi:MAG: DUF2064 domain-containing protein [Rhodospirillales bacterium]|nr:DUF2064 domain-containing protein [Rhodospirillales bacterium]